MIEFDCEEVKRQLNRLAEALPQDRVDIWLKWNESPGKLRFLAYVSNRDQLPSECAEAETVEAAVTNVLLSCGPRGDLDNIRRKREAIEKARSELAKLESELDPLVMAIDKAHADLSTQPTQPTQTQSL